MFLKRKYIFETRTTKLRRYLRSALLIMCVMIISYSFSCILFLIASNRENLIAKNTFFKKHPDIIVVFTGDKGRIPYAMKLAKDFNQTNILISGVHSKNNIDKIIRSLDLSEKIDPNLLQLDYSARNTVENVIETLAYLRSSKGLEKILIVSHDYHIVRIKTIVENIRRKTDTFKFNYIGIKTNFSKINNIKKLYQEVYKFFRTYTFLLLWGPES